MPCQDCFNGCPEPKTTDKCIQYTGDDNIILGICQGDPLAKVELQIITKLVSILNATGITFPTTGEGSLTNNCAFFQSQIGSNIYSLYNTLNALVKGECTLKGLIDIINSSINLPISVNAPCLDLPSDATRDQILVAAATKVCELETALLVVSSDYVKATELNTLIAQYIQDNTPTSPTGVTQQYTKMVPYTALPYFGPLSNFGNTGIGIATLSYDKVYLCNGLNGTPDLRGRTLVGALANVPGAAYPASVDPTLAVNAGRNYALNDTFGNWDQTLDITQIPSHNHPVTDTGHDHTIPQGNSYTGPGGSPVGRGADSPSLAKTNKSQTGIAIGAAGGGAPHNNTQPSRATYFIMYLP